MPKYSFTTRLAWFLWSLTLVGTLVGLILLARSWSAPPAGTWGFRGADALLALTFSTVGAVISGRHPQNPVGWIFAGVGLLSSIQLCAVQYAIYMLWIRPDVLPSAVIAAWIVNWVWVPSMGLFGIFVCLRFPDGHLLSPRWRMMGWLGVAGVIGLTLFHAFAPGAMDSFTRFENPFGLAVMAPALSLWYAAAYIGMILPMAVAGFSLVLRFRRANRQVRQQLKWFLSTTTLALWTFGIDSIFHRYAVKATEIVVVFALAAIPIAVGIAILKYRLYEIDIIIRRTLVYSTLTGLLALIYLACVALLQNLLRTFTVQSQYELVTVISTLAIAALFHPLRQGVQAIIDRRFYRRKYNAEGVLMAFSATLRNETDLEQVSAQLLGAVEKTIQPAHGSLWLRTPQ